MVLLRCSQEKVWGSFQRSLELIAVKLKSDQTEDMISTERESASFEVLKSIYYTRKQFPLHVSICNKHSQVSGAEPEHCKKSEPSPLTSEVASVDARSTAAKIITKIKTLVLTGDQQRVRQSQPVGTRSRATTQPTTLQQLIRDRYVFECQLYVVNQEHHVERSQCASE